MLTDPVNDLKQWRTIIDHHDAYDELILWFEHDLFDQLNLIQLLSYVHERLPATKSVSLVCIGSFPGRPHFKGLGELTPGEFNSLFGHRQRVTGSVAATDAGHAVLAGNQDRIAICGIDRWLGGVHLHSGAPVWRWNAERHRIARG
jgi:hypothetical protein